MAGRTDDACERDEREGRNRNQGQCQPLDEALAGRMDGATVDLSSEPVDPNDLAARYDREVEVLTEEMEALDVRVAQIDAEEYAERRKAGVIARIHELMEVYEIDLEELRRPVACGIKQ